ncbi:MAG: hypothetical protein ACREJP_00215, partial [Candidatus Methylomirabilales bacterium]
VEVESIDVHVGPHGSAAYRVPTPSPRIPDAKLKARQQVLLDAYLRNPERFVRGAPKPPKVPKEA